jgi:hypothetical protein
MYCMRNATLRKYTFAALKGTDEVTVPETLANPASSDFSAWADCASAFRSGSNVPQTIANSAATAAAIVRKSCRFVMVHVLQ